MPRDGTRFGCRWTSDLVLSARFKPYHVALFLAKYGWLTLRRRPVLVHFEVTLRCNARCGFCDYWKTDPSAKETELKSFADAARFFNPMIVTFTGGEPTLRRCLSPPEAATARRPVRVILSAAHSCGDQRKTGATYYDEHIPKANG